MYKGIITASTTITANTNIPFVTELNTNRNTSYDATSNAVDIVTSGLYNIDVTINLTGIAEGDIGLNLLGDGIVLPESVVSATSTATSDAISLNIHDTIRVTPDSGVTHATIALQATEDATIQNAVLTIEKVR